MIEGYFVKDGAFSASGVGIEAVTSSYPTPLYLYSAEVIADKYRRLVTHFPGFEILYSLKANPSLAICGRLRSYGAGADISSSGELRTALRAGFAPGDIVFVGPGKTESEIEAAVRSGIYAIVAESGEELDTIESVSGRLASPARVLLRINTLEEPFSPEIMVGAAGKFGFDEEAVIEQVRRVRLRSARLAGIHVYSASQVLDAGFISNHLGYVAALAVDLSDKLGFDLECVDFGGGFGVPYEATQTELDLAQISGAAAGAGKTLRDRAPNCRLVFEVGRYLTAEAGIFVTRVIRVKRSRGACFLITDGGMNHFTRPVFMGVDHAVRILNKMSVPGDTRCSVGGPICTPIDLLARDVLLPDPQAGDIVGIFDAGAYGYTMSMLNFMSMGTPAEVLADSGSLRLIRRARPPAHVLEDQIPDR